MLVASDQNFLTAKAAKSAKEKQILLVLPSAWHVHTSEPVNLFLP